MKKESNTVIVVGVGPSPIGNPNRVYATGLRLFAFSKYIHRAGFHTLMGEANFDGEDSVSSDIGEVEPGWERRFLPLDPLSASELMEKWIRETKAIAIVSTTDVMNRATAFIKTNIPKWMDFNGHPMVERQELSFIHESDEGLIDQWLYILPSLLNGDHFSTCSTPQKFALIGELGAVGRLNRHNSGCDLVTALKPCAVLHEPPPDKTITVRGKQVSNDAFCLLWNGGFNTWVDEKTLYDGVSLAMKESERIQFIITGGGIRKHNEKTFESFRKRVNRGSLSSRFHFFGWVPLKKLSNFYAEADAAINIDRFTYEAILGFRNRIFSWMNYNLPIITTPLSENTKELVNKGLALGFTPGNAEELAGKILFILKNPEKARQMAVNARKFLMEEYDYSRILIPLIDWLSKPLKAKDLELKINYNEVGEISIPGNTLSFLNAQIGYKTSAVRHLEKRLALLKGELDEQRSGILYKVCKRLGKIWGKG